MFIFQDWNHNKHDIKIRLTLVLFRLSQVLWRRGGIIKRISIPYFIFCRILIMYIFHIELLPNYNIGSHLRLFHGYALVIHPSSVIGDDVILRHCTTLGNKNSGEMGPRIGNRVNIGSNSIIIGAIHIGDDVIIGAGSVVLKDVPAGATVAGNPAEIIAKGGSSNVSLKD